MKLSASELDQVLAGVEARRAVCFVCGDDVWANVKDLRRAPRRSVQWLSWVWECRFAHAQKDSSVLRKLLRPHLEMAQADARVPDALAAAQANSVSVLRGDRPQAVRIKRQAAYLDGFSLHAGVHLHANDREGLAHLCG